MEKRKRHETKAGRIALLKLLITQVNDRLASLAASKSQYSLSEIKQLKHERQLLTDRLIDCMIEKYGKTFEQSWQVFYIADCGIVLDVLRLRDRILRA